MRVRRHLPPGINWGAITRPLARLVRGRSALVAVAVFLAAALTGYAVAAVVLFPAPIFSASQRVPRVVGLTLDAAREALTQAQLKLEESERIRHATYAAGTVVWQDPPPDVLVPQGTSVALSVSTGPPRIPVPDVAGHNEPVARLVIEAAGLRVSDVDTAQTAAPKGVVVNTRPPAGTALATGRGVTLVVSAGAPTITVPDLTGLVLDEAQKVLQESGLALGTYFQRTASAARPGTVIEQRPAPGTLAAAGTAVHVVLARRGGP
ncbi:MAG TPA: PASTA domain-containing protein [Gemmatimonadales bacterium]|nr:PASTA domain-containing protein [Gemmatimonadales bacterium]